MQRDTPAKTDDLHTDSPDQFYHTIFTKFLIISDYKKAIL
jgi:hypothetical protein